MNIDSSSALNITVNATLNITLIIIFLLVEMRLLIEKLKLMGGAMKSFSKKLLRHINCSSMVLWSMNLFWKILKNVWPPSSL